MNSLVSLLVLSHVAIPSVYEMYGFPNNSSLLAVTNFGLLMAPDGGPDWHWVCEESIDPSWSQGVDPAVPWSVTSTGAFLTVVSRGLARSADRGCSWSIASEFGDRPDGSKGPKPSSIHSSANASYAVSSTFGVTNGVWKSVDDGLSWKSLEPQSKVQYFTSIRSAPSRPDRLYVAAYWYQPTTTEALYVSDDQGLTFERIDVSSKMPPIEISDGGMEPARGALYVHAVNPRDSDHFFAVLLQDTQPFHSLVLESDDRGATFDLRYESSEPVRSITFSKDGITVWISTGRKLLKSNTEPHRFVELPVPTAQACVSRVGDQVYVCGWEPVDGFSIATVIDGGFDSTLSWRQVKSVASCPADSAVTSVCAGLFPTLLATLPRNPDGGLLEGGTGKVTKSGCGCEAASSESLTLWLFGFALAGLYAHRARRIHR